MTLPYLVFGISRNGTPCLCDYLEFNRGTRFNVHIEGAPLILMPLGILTPPAPENRLRSHRLVGNWTGLVSLGEGANDLGYPWQVGSRFDFTSCLYNGFSRNHVSSVFFPNHVSHHFLLCNTMFRCNSSCRTMTQWVNKSKEPKYSRSIIFMLAHDHRANWHVSLTTIQSG